MIYRFLLLSDESDNFLREISIDSESSFLDFHEAILKSVDFKDDQMTSFFLCEDDWEKKQEITLVDMGGASDEDNIVMSEAILHDYIEEIGQRLLYIFDPLYDRTFFIELKEIIPSKSMLGAECTYKQGNPPVATSEDDFVANFDKSISSTSIDEDFYGDNDFNEDELDEEGFSDLDESSSFDSEYM